VIFIHLLLIEDDPATSKSSALMLGHANFNVDAMDLGEAGLDLANLYDYNSILLDLGLPNINGNGVLRQFWVWRMETSILNLSGEADTENNMTGLGSGADDYLTKPFHLD
jgi:two-component system cell cycle response regulator CtrA